MARPLPGENDERPIPVDGGLLYLELNLIMSPTGDTWEMVEAKSCTSCGDVTITELCLPCGQKEGKDWILYCVVCDKKYTSCRRNATTCSKECRTINLKHIEREARLRQRERKTFLPTGHWRGLV